VIHAVDSLIDLFSIRHFAFRISPDRPISLEGSGTTSAYSAE
jgi:hypothetical protein